MTHLRTRPCRPATRSGSCHYRHPRQEEGSWPSIVERPRRASTRRSPASAITLDALKAAGLPLRHRGPASPSVDRRRQVQPRPSARSSSATRRPGRPASTTSTSRGHHHRPSERRGMELIAICGPTATAEVARGDGEASSRPQRFRTRSGHDGRLGCSRQPASSSARSPAIRGLVANPTWRHHPPPDQGELPRGPRDPCWSTSSPRTGARKGLGRHRAPYRRLGLPDPPSGRRGRRTLIIREERLRHHARAIPIDSVGQPDDAAKAPGCRPARRDRRARPGPGATTSP